jgi:hypothetical protein
MSRKLKLKHFRSDQSGAAFWPQKISPPIHRRFTALSPHFFTALPLFCRTFSGFEAGFSVLSLLAAIWPPFRLARKQ